MLKRSSFPPFVLFCFVLFCFFDYVRLWMFHLSFLPAPSESLACEPLRISGVCFTLPIKKRATKTGDLPAFWLSKATSEDFFCIFHVNNEYWPTAARLSKSEI